MYRLISEWDLGQGDTVFSSKDAARAYAREALPECGIEESLEELEDENLIDYQEVRLQ